MIILDGKKIAGKILEDLAKNGVAKKLRLVAVQVGENAVSKKYIREKQKACKKIGARFELFEFPKAIDAKELKAKIKKIGEDPRNTGIIVQLPLPAKFPTKEILDCIVQEKDIDVLSTKSFERFKKGELEILPPTVKAISLLLEESGVSLPDKEILILGMGRLVGQPLKVWFLNQQISPSVADKSTKNIFELAQRADIIISATGKAGLLKGDMIKPGVIVIDAGISVEGGAAKGDVDFKSVSKKASFIAKVPGGVGPLTVACLLQNLCILATMHQ